MKKFLLILIVFTMFLGLVGCNRDIPNDNLNIDCSINPSDEACLDPSTWNWEYNKTNFDGKNQEVIITVDSLEEMFEKEQIMLIENEYNTPEEERFGLEDKLYGYYYNHAMKCGNSFVSTWFELNLDVNNILAAMTARKYKMEVAKVPVGTNPVAEALRTS